MEKKNFSQIFAQRVTQVIKEMNLNQTSLAELIDVTPQAIQFWCRGTVPKFDNLKRLAEVTNKPVYWFLTPDQGLSESTLSFEQQQLLELFSSLPKKEKSLLINELEKKKQYYDELLTELLDNQKK